MEPESFRDVAKNLNIPQRDKLKDALINVLNRWDKFNDLVAEDFYDWARCELADAYWSVFEERFLNGEKGYRTPGGYDKSKDSKETFYKITFSTICSLAETIETLAKKAEEK